MSCDLEPIRESDVEALKDLFASAGPFITSRTPSDYWLYARLFRSTCLCLRNGSNLEAAVIAFKDQNPGTSEVYIQDIAVRSSARGKGLGLELLSTLVDRLQGEGIGRIWLTSEPENKAALALWSKAGFVNVEADYLVDGVWLTRDLKGPGKDRAVFELIAGARR